MNHPNDAHENCLCGGYAVAIHPAWAAFYAHMQVAPFASGAEATAWWKGQNCPTDHAGRLILPPEEIPCPVCTSAVAA